MTVTDRRVNPKWRQREAERQTMQVQLVFLCFMNISFNGHQSGMAGVFLRK